MMVGSFIKLREHAWCLCNKPIYKFWMIKAIEGQRSWQGILLGRLSTMPRKLKNHILQSPSAFLMRPPQPPLPRLPGNPRWGSRFRVGVWPTTLNQNIHVSSLWTKLLFRHKAAKNSEEWSFDPISVDGIVSSENKLKKYLAAEKPTLFGFF